MGFWLLLVLGIIGCESAALPTPSATKAATATMTPQIGVDFVTRAQPTIAIVQISPTPLPTATPTPTATPVVYNIAEGDTIWSIAYLNGTVPDKVLELNPQIRPELLKIGDSLVLPPPATPIYQEIAGTPIPLQIRVTNLQLYETPVGSLWILGEVENLGSFSAENIQVEVSLYGTEIVPLQSVNAWVLPGILAAGAKAPFGTLIRDIPANTSTQNDGGYNTTASVVAGGTLTNLGSRYLDIEVTESTMSTTEEGQATVSGTVKNIGEFSAENIQLISSLYDANGNVSGYFEQTLAGLLAPNDTMPFSFTVSPPGAEPIRTQILTQALRSSEE